eukprot:Tamp_08854.p1 GENE.Tamp_08854~~Tamp_08854.p1  ORF type:complete len:563 (-),score=33.34 Tamp_08854:536-2224(-)
MAGWTRLLLLLARAGVLAGVFHPYAASPTPSSCSSLEDPVLHEFYVKLALHVALSLFACIPVHKTGGKWVLGLEAASRWLLLGVTAFLTGQSEERWTLGLLCSEVFASIFGTGHIHPLQRAGALRQILAEVKQARSETQRQAAKLSLSVVRQLLEHLAFSTQPAGNALDTPTSGFSIETASAGPRTSDASIGSMPGSVTWTNSKSWTTRAEGAARDILQSLVTVTELSIDSVSFSCLGELRDVQLFGGSEEGAFTLDIKGFVHGHLQVENSLHVTAADITLTVKVTLLDSSPALPRTLPSSRTLPVDSLAKVSVSNVRVTFVTNPTPHVQNPPAYTSLSAVQLKLAHELEARMTTLLSTKPITLPQLASCHELAGHPSHELDAGIVESIAGSNVCLLMRMCVTSLSNDLFGATRFRERFGHGWRVRARVLAPSVGKWKWLGGARERPLVWQRGRTLNASSGPSRAAMTLMLGSDQDIVELQVLPSMRSTLRPQDADLVLGAWRGPATALLLPTVPRTPGSKKDSDSQSVIRVEGDVRLPLLGGRHGPRARVAWAGGGCGRLC